MTYWAIFAAWYAFGWWYMQYVWRKSLGLELVDAMFITGVAVVAGPFLGMIWGHYSLVREQAEETKHAREEAARAVRRPLETQERVT